MLVGDLIHNDSFDVNCNYEIYEGQWNDGGRLLWSSLNRNDCLYSHNDGYSQPPCELLDRKIGYITIDDAIAPLIVIEVSANEE